MLKIEKDSIFSLKKIIGEYSFRLNEIPDVEVKIKLYKYADNTDIFFETSHYIHTPTQAGVYITSRNSARTEEIALEMAINTITNYYESAISDGYEPSIDWLQENESF